MTAPKSPFPYNHGAAANFGALVKGHFGALILARLSERACFCFIKNLCVCVLAFQKKGFCGDWVKPQKVLYFQPFLYFRYHSIMLDLPKHYTMVLDYATVIYTFVKKHNILQICHSINTLDPGKGLD